jgi:NAD(P)H-dependent FMN reductase
MILVHYCVEMVNNQQKKMTRINILSATDRPNSKALMVSRYVQSLYEERGVQTKICTLKDFPIDAIAGGRYGSDIPSVTEFNNEVLDADGLLMVVPEYNGGFPGILKLWIDYLPFPEAFEKLPIALIGEASGAFGALRPVEQLQMILGYRNANVFPERVFIPRVGKEFDTETGLADEFKQKLLISQTNGFIRFIEALKSADIVVQS